MYDLSTSILSDNPQDADPRAFVIAVKEHSGYQAISDAELYDIAYWLNYWAGVTKIRASIEGARILHETGFLRYGGDVQANQHNYAGLGATGGIPGATFPDARTGVLAVFMHEIAYVYGRNVPAELQNYINVDPRFNAVLSAGYGGTVRVIGDYTNGKWAFSKQYPVGSLENGYAYALRDKANLLLGIQARNMEPLRIAVNAGHNNTAGGNETEKVQTRKITHEFVKRMRGLGHDIRVAQPNEGLGQYSGTYNDWAIQVTQWTKSGVWIPHIYLSIHTEGNDSGDTARGVFGVVPDAIEEPKSEKNISLINSIVEQVKAKTGIPFRGSGVMSEFSTGVGRLGEFRNTQDIRGSTLRVLIEYGSHSSPADMVIMNRADYPANCAIATIDGIAKYYNDVIEVPPVTEYRYFEETGHAIGHGFKGYWENDDNPIPTFGYPLTEEFYDLRYAAVVQYFERARFEHRPGFTGNPYQTQLGRIGAELLEAYSEIDLLKKRITELAEELAHARAAREERD